MLSLLTLLRTGIAPTRLPMSPSALRLLACCCTAFAALWLLLLLLCCCFPVPAGLEGGMGLPPCCSTCFLFSSATVVCCLLASMVPFLPELSVRGEAAPNQTNKASNCTRLHKVLITSLRPNKETFSLFLCPTHNSKSLPKANHINKKNL
jgi:hypothetical protein